MMNPLWFLGFLSFLSLSYISTGKTAFLWFLGFLPYFSLYKTSEERTDQNIGRAARNAFMYTIATGSVSVIYIALTQQVSIFGAAFALLFGGALLIYLFSFLYYDRLGK